jgi:2-polyprenyl-6-methoxyphenol hydroxylase-like FAD-dependent oxidoreductase
VVAKLNDSGLWRVSYGEKTGLTDEELRARLEMKYEAIFPGPRPLEYDLKMFSPYRLHQKCASRFRVAKVLLAGDAAHLCNPFGG